MLKEQSGENVDGWVYTPNSINLKDENPPMYQKDCKHEKVHENLVTLSV